MKYDIWSPAEEKLHELYGNEIPQFVMERYRREKTLLQDTDVEMLLSFLRHLSMHFHDSKATFTMRGGIGASFVCWLLGITEVNPLPAHYYCPHCRCLQFDGQKKYGWDLPEKCCACGETMLRDGMGTPWLAEIDLEKQIHVDVDIPGELQDDVQQQLLSFFPGQAFIRASFQQDDMVKYYFLSDEDNHEGYDQQDRIIRMNYRDASEQKYPYPSILFLKSWKDTLLWELCREKNIAPQRIPWLSDDTLRSYLQYTLPGILYDDVYDNAALIKEVCPADFGDLLLFLGFDHATVKGYEEIKAIVRSRPQAIRDFDIYAEDIYECLLNHLKRNGILDEKLAVHVAAQARLGKYTRAGIDTETQKRLISIGLPDGYIQYLTKIRYLFPRGHMLTRLARNIHLGWFCMNDSAIWAEIAGDHYRDLIV